MNVIHKSLVGSRLFGVNNANSDYDYKAIALPSRKEVLLGDASFSRQYSTGNNTTKNTSEDEDFTVYSYQKYLSMLSKMDTIALELLFAPNIFNKPTLIDYLYNQRFKFLWGNKDSFVGFGKSQAMKYMVRGNRLHTLESVVDVFSKMPKNDTLNKERDSWESLLTLDGVEIVPGPGELSHIDYLVVYGRQVPVTVRYKDAVEVFLKPLREVGKRTKTALEQGGADWKGLYHAHRVVDEGVELFSTGKLNFPCKNAEFYRDVRSGSLTLEKVLDIFEHKLQVLEELKPIPEFNGQPNYEWVQEHLCEVHSSIVGQNLTVNS